MKQPGVLLYFDIRPCLKRLSKEEKGELFEAILEYGEFGTVPDFNGCLGIAWDFIQPKIDRDKEKYLDTVDKRKYASYVRDERKAEREPVSFEEWKHQMTSHDVTCYPTTSPSPSPAPAPAPAPAPTTGERGREADFNRRRNESIEKLKNWSG